MKKKILAIFASAAMCLGLCGCGNTATSSTTSSTANNSSADKTSSVASQTSATESASADNTDWNYIKNKGEMIVGITYNMPMNYQDENGELTGFETEFTKAVCEKLGVTPKFQVIEWSKKEIELKAKTIDVIWNGLTVTEERKENILFSTSYLKNKQVTVVKAENADKYPDTASMANISIAFESGSAGEDIIKNDAALKDCKQVNCEAQKDAMLEVKSGTADACIVDYTLAKAFTKEGTDYSDLKVLENIQNTDEEYAIGARLEDKETISKINAAIDEVAKDGTLKAIAEKYDLADALLVGGESTASDVSAVSTAESEVSAVSSESTAA